MRPPANERRLECNRLERDFFVRRAHECRNRGQRAFDAEVTVTTVLGHVGGIERVILVGGRTLGSGEILGWVDSGRKKILWVSESEVMEISDEETAKLNIIGTVAQNFDDEWHYLRCRLPNGSLVENIAPQQPHHMITDSALRPLGAGNNPACSPRRIDEAAQQVRDVRCRTVRVARFVPLDIVQTGEELHWFRVSDSRWRCQT